MNAKVAQHGVRLPAAKELDGVFVDSSAEESGCSTRPQGTGGEELPVYASVAKEVLSRVLEGIADVCVFDTIPTAVGRMRVEMTEDGSSWSRSPAVEARGDPAKSLGRAEKGIGGGAVAHLLTPDGVLLISESQGGIGNAGDKVRIIQRCCRGVVDHVAGGEVDVLELEWLAAGALSSGLKVFRGTKQPEEGDNDEVDGVFVEGAMDWVFCVKV